jgi:GNAT superfamily N-acetyltransferase
VGALRGGWCTWFHPRRAVQDSDVEPGRPYKKRLVREGRAHAALVFDGEVAVAWCEYGTPEELPNIYHRKEYEAGLDRAPDYRLTCFFVDRNHRRRGVAAVALQGALELIAQAGGGVVEGNPPARGRSTPRRACGHHRIRPWASGPAAPPTGGDQRRLDAVELSGRPRATIRRSRRCRYREAQFRGRGRQLCVVGDEGGHLGQERVRGSQVDGVQRPESPDPV